MKRGGPEHPKVAALASLLNIPIYGSVGILELLWHFTARYAPQGDIGKYTDKAIAKAVYWDKRPGRTIIPAQFMPNSGLITSELWLISSLIRAQFVDISAKYRLVIHDWSDHADEAVRKFLSRHSLDFVETQSSLPLPVPVPVPIPTPAKAGKTPNSENGHPVKDFIAAWHDSYLEVTGKKYILVKGADSGQAKRLLEGGADAAEIIGIARRAWIKDGFYCKQAHSLASFVKHIGNIRNELDPAARWPAQSTWKNPMA